MPSGGSWDIGQVCLNGHAITDILDTHPELGQNYCHECGEPTIFTCPTCGVAIHGRYWYPNGLYFGYTPPKFCHDCGAVYPWTARRLAAAAELADELELSDEDKRTVKDRLPSIVQNTPTAEASAYKLKRLLNKAERAGSVAAGVLYKVVLDFASETAKKVLTGP